MSKPQIPNLGVFSVLDNELTGELGPEKINKNAEDNEKLVLYIVEYLLTDSQLKSLLPAIIKKTYKR